MERRRFPRGVRSLAAIHEFVTGFLAANRIDPAWAFDVDLLIEELFTNMVKHNHGGRHEIEVGLAASDATLTITVRDFDVDSFDPTTVAPADTEQLLREGQRGGVGLRLVRGIADDLRYEYKDGSPTVTVTKRLER